ncbi:hypothetical protein CKK34_6705 [Yarrowia sp. E02]|nr:hypothetical protein CKK34_6705 [Yarrowia sp. E02]
MTVIRQPPEVVKRPSLQEIKIQYLQHLARTTASNLEVWSGDFASICKGVNGTVQIVASLLEGQFDARSEPAFFRHETAVRNLLTISNELKWIELCFRKHNETPLFPQDAAVFLFTEDDVVRGVHKYLHDLKQQDALELDDHSDYYTPFSSPSDVPERRESDQEENEDQDNQGNGSVSDSGSDSEPGQADKSGSESDSDGPDQGGAGEGSGGTSQSGDISDSSWVDVSMPEEGTGEGGEDTAMEDNAMEDVAIEDKGALETDTPETALQTATETASDTVPETVPETVRETVAESSTEAPETVPETITASQYMDTSLDTSEIQDTLADSVHSETESELSESSSDLSSSSPGSDPEADMPDVPAELRLVGSVNGSEDNYFMLPMGILDHYSSSPGSGVGPETDSGDETETELTVALADTAPLHPHALDSDSDSEDSVQGGLITRRATGTGEASGQGGGLITRTITGGPREEPVQGGGLITRTITGGGATISWQAGDGPPDREFWEDFRDGTESGSEMNTDEIHEELERMRNGIPLEQWEEPEVESEVESEVELESEIGHSETDAETGHSWTFDEDTDEEGDLGQVVEEGQEGEEQEGQEDVHDVQGQYDEPMEEDRQSGQGGMDDQEEQGRGEEDGQEEQVQLTEDNDQFEQVEQEQTEDNDQSEQEQSEQEQSEQEQFEAQHQVQDEQAQSDVSSLDIGEEEEPEVESEPGSESESGSESKSEGSEVSASEGSAQESTWREVIDEMQEDLSRTEEELERLQEEEKLKQRRKSRPTESATNPHHSREYLEYMGSFQDQSDTFVDSERYFYQAEEEEEEEEEVEGGSDGYYGDEEDIQDQESDSEEESSEEEVDAQHSDEVDSQDQDVQMSDDSPVDDSSDQPLLAQSSLERNAMVTQEATRLVELISRPQRLETIAEEEENQQTMADRAIDWENDDVELLMSPPPDQVEFTEQELQQQELEQEQQQELEQQLLQSQGQEVQPVVQPTVHQSAVQTVQPVHQSPEQRQSTKRRCSGSPVREEGQQNGNYNNQNQQYQNQQQQNQNFHHQNQNQLQLQNQNQIVHANTRGTKRKHDRPTIFHMFLARLAKRLKSTHPDQTRCAGIMSLSGTCPLPPGQPPLADDFESLADFADLNAQVDPDVSMTSASTTSSPDRRSDVDMTDRHPSSPFPDARPVEYVPEQEYRSQPFRYKPFSTEPPFNPQSFEHWGGVYKHDPFASTRPEGWKHPEWISQINRLYGWDQNRHHSSNQWNQIDSKNPFAELAVPNQWNQNPQPRQTVGNPFAQFAQPNQCNSQNSQPRQSDNHWNDDSDSQYDPSQYNPSQYNPSHSSGPQSRQDNHLGGRPDASGEKGANKEEEKEEVKDEVDGLKDSESDSTSNSDNDNSNYSHSNNEQFDGENIPAQDMTPNYSPEKIDIVSDDPDSDPESVQSIDERWEQLARQEKTETTKRRRNNPREAALKAKQAWLDLNKYKLMNGKGEKDSEWLPPGGKRKMIK